VEDGPDGQIAFEIFKGFFDLRQQSVKFSDLTWLALSEVSPQQIVPFPATHRTESFFTQAVRELF
jgi:hypothetical protein